MFNNKKVFSLAMGFLFGSEQFSKNCKDLLINEIGASAVQGNDVMLAIPSIKALEAESKTAFCDILRGYFNTLPFVDKDGNQLPMKAKEIAITHPFGDGYFTNYEEDGSSEIVYYKELTFDQLLMVAEALPDFNTAWMPVEVEEEIEA